jgi:hypothetical protein
MDLSVDLDAFMSNRVASTGSESTVVSTRTVYLVDRKHNIH